MKTSTFITVLLTGVVTTLSQSLVLGATVFGICVVLDIIVFGGE